MRSEFVGVTGALGVAVLLSYFVVTQTPQTRKAALGAWDSGQSLLCAWAAVTPVTAAAFLILWHDAGFSDDHTNTTDLLAFTFFLLSAFLWSTSIIELNISQSVINVWLTALASCLLIAVPLTTSSSTLWLIWVSYGVVVFHHVVIDGVLWAGPLMSRR
ncbi:MAG: hypothetical protein CL678_11800 [Bdellovibrionaceae bacterium]|nr:hypothetical protein [Pseudobdellovibrionaceae bacterium]